MQPFQTIRLAVLTGLVLGVSLPAAGCSSSPSAVSVPDISPQEAARLALAEYDANHDGFLDAKELERCPALKNALKDLDKNGDKRISADEIAERLEGFRASGAGLIGLPCRIELDGGPEKGGKYLPGATVTLRPEAFMGPAFKPASGVTDERGQVILKTEGQTIPGVRWGYFRIEVSKKDASGKETVPARYNTATTLGEEVAPERKKAMILRLSSS